MDIDVRLTDDLSDDEFLAALRAFEGVTIGPPVPAPDEVNVPMIRHWCDAMGDTNPVYLDEGAAAASGHGALVAPPTMLQAWVMRGYGTSPRGDAAGPYEQMTQLLFSRDFRSVVATNCDQTYHRYLHPGDRLTMAVTIESISERKEVALGSGHFVTTRQDYFDEHGDLVGTMSFRILRFKPKAKAPPLSPAPRRPRPATTHDNQWWFEALNEGRLLIQRCVSCLRLRHPAGPMCPACHALAWDTVEAAGTGTIHSFVVTHFPQVPGFKYPLPVVLVDLDEGVRVVMNTIGTPNDHLVIGASVAIEIHATDPDMRLPFARVIQV